MPPRDFALWAKCEIPARAIMFLLVIATGSTLLHCSMDDFSKVNETRIKVLSSYPSTLKFDVPVEKKAYL